jgi:hypothetical protein
LAVTVVPTVAAPLIVGGELFDGATADRDTTAPAAPTTTSAATAAIASTERGDHFMRIPLSACSLAIAGQLGDRSGDYSPGERSSYGFLNASSRTARD